MKMFMLVRPDYEGDEIIGIFSTNENARAYLNKGYWHPEHFKIEEYEIDPIAGDKQPIYYAHAIDSHRDWGPLPFYRDHDSWKCIPNEQVWNYDKVQARGLGKTAEEATRRVHELLVEYADIPASGDHMPLVTIPRPDLCSQ